jgi:hypothetical protein
MKIYLSTRENNCADKEEVEITKGNIIHRHEWYNYRYQYHKDYKKYSEKAHPDNIVNTRFDFGKENKIEMYSYLNYWERLQLNIVCNKTWLQQDANYKWLIGMLFGFIVGKLVH